MHLLVGVCTHNIFGFPLLNLSELYVNIIAQFGRDRLAADLNSASRRL